jgi:hypothetical protein
LNFAAAVVASFAKNADTAAHVATVIATAVLGLWAYSRFVAQQITRPPIEFTVESVPIGIVGGKRLIRITFRVRNGSTRECDVWLYWSLRGLRGSLQSLDGLEAENPACQVALEYIYPVRRDDRKDERPGRVWQPAIPRPNFIPVLKGNYRTFVGAGVTQQYTFTTAVELDYAFATVVGSINYMRSRSGLAKLTTPLALLLSGLSPRETRAVTFDHTTSSVVVLEPPPASDRAYADGLPRSVRGGPSAAGEAS